jgi:hypothetical protein
LAPRISVKVSTTGNSFARCVLRTVTSKWLHCKTILWRSICSSLCVSTLSVGAQLRQSGGQNVPVAYKEPILLTAAALTWSRSRTKQFANAHAGTVFRYEPNLPIDECWYDAALPPYNSLSSNTTAWAFTSTSLSAYFPLVFGSQSGGAATAVRVLVIYRNESSPTSASYLWPVYTMLASELTYAPGSFFYHLACRREFVPPFMSGLPGVNVAYTLMYEATTSDRTRLDAASEQHIERRLNAAIDAWNTTCVPYLCQAASSGWWNWPGVRASIIPMLFACVDVTTNRTAAAAFTQPNRVVPNAQCRQVDDAVHFMLTNLQPNTGLCLTANASAGAVAYDYCTSSQNQTFNILVMSGAKAFEVRMSACTFCLSLFVASVQRNAAVHSNFVI